MSLLVFFLIDSGLSSSQIRNSKPPYEVIQCSSYKQQFIVHFLHWLCTTSYVSSQVHISLDAQDLKIGVKIHAKIRQTVKVLMQIDVEFPNISCKVLCRPSDSIGYLTN